MNTGACVEGCTGKRQPPPKIIISEDKIGWGFVFYHWWEDGAPGTCNFSLFRRVGSDYSCPGALNANEHSVLQKPYRVGVSVLQSSTGSFEPLTSVSRGFGPKQAGANRSKLAETSFNGQNERTYKFSQDWIWQFRYERHPKIWQSDHLTQGWNQDWIWKFKECKSWKYVDLCFS